MEVKAMKTKSFVRNLSLFVLFLVMVSALFGQEKPTVRDTTHKAIVQQEKKDSTIVVKGTVYGEDNTPLPGASIIVAGTTLGTTTDIDGKFTLKVWGKAKLKISYTGFSEMVLDVENSENLQIRLGGGLSKICCRNHVPAHCAKSMDEARQLTTEHNCIF
jgi:hypothetical protein